MVGLAAKPIIDMMPVVYSLKDVDKAAAEFEKIGYEYMGEFGISGRRYLRKGGDERTHQMHMFMERTRMVGGLPFPAVLPADRMSQVEARAAIDAMRQEAEGYCHALISPP